MRRNSDQVLKDQMRATGGADASLRKSPAATSLASSEETCVSSKSNLRQMPRRINQQPDQPTDPNGNAPGGANRPAAYVLNAKSDLVLRASRETGDVIKVARRLGVRANDVFRVVLKRLDEAEGRKAA